MQRLCVLNACNTGKLLALQQHIRLGEAMLGANLFSAITRLAAAGAGCFAGRQPIQWCTVNYSGVHWCGPKTCGARNMQVSRVTQLGR